MEHNKSREPYVFFFSAGILSALLAVSYWPLAKYGLVPYYPRDAHANTMIYGFFWAFVVGFLQTAVPRMTNTPSAKSFEINSGLTFIAAQIVINIFNFPTVSRVINLGQIICLGLFLYRRWILIRKLPFEGFLFLPFALFCAIIGNFILLFWPEKNFLGYSLITEGFLINLVIGIGSRLFPVLMRIKGAIAPDQGPSSFLKNKVLLFSLQALFFNTNFIFAAWGFEKISVAIKIAFIVMVSITNLKILKPSSSKTFLGYGLRISILAMIIGYIIWLSASETTSISSQHIVFIAGLMLATLMVATRVTLAHGGGHLDTETTSLSLVSTIGLCVLAATLRYVAQPDPYSTTMILAAVVFIFALAVWSKEFVSFLWRKNDNR